MDSKKLTTSWNTNQKVVFISVALFVISLFLPVYYGNGSSDNTPGFVILIGGLPGVILFSLLGQLPLWLLLGWLANPVLYLAYLCADRNRYRCAVAASLVSVLLALSCLKYINREFSIGIEYSSILVGYGIGYWLWLASIVSMMLGSLYLLYLSRRAVPTLVNDSSEKQAVYDFGWVKTCWRILRSIFWE